MQVDDQIISITLLQYFMKRGNLQQPAKEWESHRLELSDNFD